MTTLAAAYRSQYPGAYAVALLCEGDLLGYEAAVLRRLQNDRPVTRRADVWPCGTRESAHGLADSYGRAVPVVIVEDRDFRTEEEAEADCRESLRTRKERGCRVAGWRAWRRNEIENYLLEPPVVLPVMTRWFACSEGAVLDALGQVVVALRVCQATERAFHRVERLLADRCGPGRLRGNVSRRPTWVAEDPYLNPPEAQAVRQQATAAVTGCIASCEGRGDLPTTVVSALETALDEGLDEWAAVVSEDESWRIDWAGKEVLQHLRMLLAARHGWIAQGSTERQVIAWHTLNRRDRDALDRDIEREMRGELVARFLQWLDAEPETDVAQEWREVVETVAEAANGQVESPNRRQAWSV